MSVARPFGAYLIFVRWSRMGAQKAEGHLETDFLAWGARPREAERALGAMPLAEAQRALDTLIAARDGGVHAALVRRDARRRRRRVTESRGTVLNGTGGVWTVRTADGTTLDASLRGRLKQEAPR